MGGKRLVAGAEFFPPTLLAHVVTFRCMQGRKLAPIVPVIRGHDEEALLRMKTTSLGSRPRSGEKRQTRQALGRDLDVGTVYQNRCDS